MRRLSRSLGKLGREERGVTVVEFAILCVPLFVTIMGLMDLGYMMYCRSVLQGALNDVARLASVETPVFTATGNNIDQKIDAAIKDRMSMLARGGTYVIRKNSYYEFSRVGKPEKLVTDVNRNGSYDTGDCWQDINKNNSYDSDGGKSGIGGADDIVVYDVTLTAPRLMPMAGLLRMPANYVINVKSTIRNQPYADQPDPPVRC